VSSEVDVTYTIRADDEAILSNFAEELARKQMARYEESKEETKEDEDNELCNRFRTAFSRERFEESKEETKEEDHYDEQRSSGFQPCSDYYEEETKEEDYYDAQHSGFQPCPDYYEEEELDVDPTQISTFNGLANFRIVTHEDSAPPEVTWIIQAMYNNWHDLQFKLKTPEGVYMLLYADEIVKCVLILVEDDDGSAYFQIEDLYGNILFADCDQIEAHILYIISTETRKRQAMADQGVLDSEPKRRRKYSGPLTSGVRKLSEIMKKRCSSSQSS